MRRRWEYCALLRACCRKVVEGQAWKPRAASLLRSAPLLLLAPLLLALPLTAIPSGRDCPAADWPAWRHDAQRSAATSEPLATPLEIQWRVQLAPPRMAWPEDPRLHFDGSLEPIAAGGIVFVASSRADCITALRLNNGERAWQFFADGPIRFAPLAVDGHLYFGSDDGYFYCLEARSGRLCWKFRAAPGERRVLGNERIISAWPLRGGPVPRSGKIHFTVGIWPFEGTMLVSVDADPESARYESRLLSEDLSPQGYLAASGDRLFIPCGRDEAACLDLATDRFVPLRYTSRGKTDYHVTAAGDLLLHGDRVFDVAHSRLLPHALHRPVTDPAGLYGVNGGAIVALDRAQPKVVTRTDRRGKKTEEHVFPQAWKLPVEQLAAVTGQPKEAPLSVEFKAGTRLFGYHGDAVFALDMSDADQTPQVVWTTTLPSTPTRMLTADGKLLVATNDGGLYALGHSAAASQPDSPNISGKESKPGKKTKPSEESGSDKGGAQDVPAAAAETVEQMLQGRADRGGYALVFGGDDETRLTATLEALVAGSTMHAIVVQPDAARAETLRAHFAAQGTYGTRIAVLPGVAGRTALPPFLANLIVVDSLTGPVLDDPQPDDPQPDDPQLDDGQLDDGQLDDGALRQIFHCLRPYGGQAWIACPRPAHTALAARIAEAGWKQARVERRGQFTVLTRSGALPGSADWTHEYGDTANTLMSRDTLVKPPFGALWFGGPASANELFFNRHFWPPSLTVNSGRMYMQGPRVFSAVDIYTGRVLWKKPLEEGHSPGRRGNFFERVRVGFHYVAADDAVYLSNGSRCEVLDPQTGKLRTTFRFEQPEARWGRFRIWKNLLIGTVFLPAEDGELRPLEIVALNRQSGETVWKHRVAYSVPFVAIGGDKVFFYDGVIHKLYDDWKRKGKVPEGEPYRYVRALDAQSGKLLWERTTGRIVTWLGYSEDQDVLIGSNKTGLDAWKGTGGKELWRREQEGKGFAGHPESVWDKVILWNDRVIDQRGPGLAYDLKTGNEMMQAHPLTGKQEPWKFTKIGHHCNYAIASPHMLTFRAGTAGFLDLESGATGRLNGFRSGCRNSLIPAGGVLNAPKFAHGCSCSYSMFSSLALIHLPDADMWTYNAFSRPEGTVQRVGINLGAPGDRKAASGTFWLDYPNVGGPSPDVAVTAQGKSLRYFRRHTRQVSGEELTWVAASGAEGLNLLTLQLGGSEPRRCNVKLYFVEPDDVAAGDRAAGGKRRFDVALQGSRVLEDFDILQAAGGHANRLVTREFSDIMISGKLTIELTPRSGKTVLCGVEITPSS